MLWFTTTTEHIPLVLFYVMVCMLNWKQRDGGITLWALNTEPLGQFKFWHLHTVYTEQNAGFLLVKTNFLVSHTPKPPYLAECYVDQKSKLEDTTTGHCIKNACFFLNNYKLEWFEPSKVRDVGSGEPLVLI